MRTIKDIIDAERWAHIEPPDWNHDADDHNAALDRVEAALKNEIKQIERAAEMEEQTPKIKPTGVVHREYHAAVVERLEQRIAELEAELKETVAELDAALADNKVANMRVTELEADKKWLHDFIRS